MRELYTAIICLSAFFLSGTDGQCEPCDVCDSAPDQCASDSRCRVLSGSAVSAGLVDGVSTICVALGTCDSDCNLCGNDEQSCSGGSRGNCVLFEGTCRGFDCALNCDACTVNDCQVSEAEPNGCVVDSANNAVCLPAGLTTTLQPTLPDLETPSPSLITEDTCCGCIEQSGESGCAADPVCETVVCEVDDRCCQRRWGFNCVAAALTICSNLETCCGCLNPQQTGGCRNDLECTGVICDNDEYCCNSQWDTLCVSQATSFCNGEPLPICCGCTQSTNFFGCLADEECQQIVCDDDPFCCGADENQNGVWDQECSAAATAICTAVDTTTTTTTTTSIPLQE